MEIKKDMQLSFSKMHGAGNDFVVIDGRHGLPFSLSEFAIKVCDRHFGIGADGIIVLEVSNVADFRMRYHNADGTSAICGNGIRCIARYIYQHNLIPSEERRLAIEIDTGVVQVEVIGKGERVKVEMPEPEFEGALIPVDQKGEHIGFQLKVDGINYTATAVGMGNPHCVIFVDSLEQLKLEEIGPKIEHHPFFPQRTNVEFVQVINEEKLKIRIWERGVGETLACGTGTCAVGAAAIRMGKAARRIVVSSQGGEFELNWPTDASHISLIGPAVEVFTGELRPNNLFS